MTAESAGSIVYSVEADVKNLVSNMSQTRDELSKAGAEMDRTDKSADKLNSGLSALSKAFAALGVAKALSSATELVEKYNEYADRIRLATKDTQEFEMVQARLADSANNTYRSLSEAQEVFITTSAALKSLGYNTSQALDITDSLSYAMVKNATSVDRAKSAIGAFSKAIQTGKVDADAWSSILQAVPTIVNDIASATGKTAEEVRKLGASGKLAADDINQSLLKSLKSNKDAADAMATSTKDAFRQIENSLGKTLSALNDQSGALDAVVKGIKLAAAAIQDFGNDADGMANFLTVAGTAAAATATVIAGRLVGALGSAAATQAALVVTTLNSVNASQASAGANLMLAQAELAAAKAAEAKLVATRAANLGLSQGAASADAMAAATARVTAAQAGVTTALAASAGAATTTSVAMKGLNAAMTFLGGPLGVILIAAAALYYFASASQATKTDVDALNASLKNLSFAQLAQASNTAGDDIEKLNKKLSASLSELRTQTRRPFESDENFQKRQTENQAEVDGIRQQIKARQDLQKSIKDQQDAITTKQIDDQKPREGKQYKTSEADEKALKALKDDAAAAKLSGEARARLIGEQKLSAEASEAERKAAGDLAVEIYRGNEGRKDAVKGTNEQQEAAKANAKAIKDYAISVGEAAMKGEDLIRAQAQAKLNKFATPEDVKLIDDLAKALYEVQTAKRAAGADPVIAANENYKEQVREIEDLENRGALSFQRAEKLKTQAAQERNDKLKQLALEESGRAKLNSVDPIANEATRFADQMQTLEQLRAQDVLNEQRYQDLKTAAAMDHDEKVKALEEAAFIRQSEGNAFLIRSIDALGQATTSTLTGLLSGTMNAQDAMKGFASIILNEAVGSLVQMGVQAVKTALIQRTSAATAAAAYVGGVASQVATTTALAGQAAYASTAAIPVTGPALAPGAAATAISAAGALGAPAVTSAAGVAGGRLYGGDVNAGSMYAVAEDGSPEIFKSDNGKQYMIPGSGGEVISNKNASAGGGSIVINQVFNFDSDGSASATSDGGGRQAAIAEQFKAMTITIISQEAQPGGAIWEAVNDRG